VRKRAAGDKLRSAPPGIEEFLHHRHAARQLIILGSKLIGFFHIRVHGDATDGMKDVGDLACFHANRDWHL